MTALDNPDTPLTTTTVDFFEVASELARAHAYLLQSDTPVSVAAILVKGGRCPSCAAPLLRDGRSCVCSACGQQVIRA